MATGKNAGSTNQVALPLASQSEGPNGPPLAGVHCLCWGGLSSSASPPAPQFPLFLFLVKFLSPNLKIHASEISSDWGLLSWKGFYRLKASGLQDSKQVLHPTSPQKRNSGTLGIAGHGGIQGGCRDRGEDLQERSANPL